MKNLETPTNEFVAAYIAKYNNDIKYSATDKAISSAIKVFPQNVKLEEILLKVCVINGLYSTNIYDTFRMASHIFNLQIDESLVSNDLALVSKIAKGHGIVIKKSGNERCLYSFATKYCHWHSREKYPIYDSFVSGLLIDYRKKDNFSKFIDSDLKDSIPPSITLLYMLMKWRIIHFLRGGVKTSKGYRCGKYFSFGSLENAGFAFCVKGGGKAGDNSGAGKLPDS